ncbi:MAG: FGGY family carbohydrate kinase, partial [Spirochaetia bacterium]
MGEQFIVALDQGTTSSRAVVFDRAGTIHGVGRREFTQHYPQPGWVEHDPLEIWDSQEKVLYEALKAAEIDANQIGAIGITNQRETTILWNRRTGEPVHNAIVWQCRRTAGICDQLIRDGHAELFRNRTGLIVDASFSGTKITWLLDNLPDARKAAEEGKLAFGTVDTWLLWKLTGGAVHATDVTNAARTMLFNIHTLEWDAELLDLLGIPPAIMPEVLPSSGEFGTTSDSFFPGTPVRICGIAGDQHAALFGQAAFE